MKKRILSMLLCVMMVVTAIPLALVPTVAADAGAEEAATPTITYDDLYVKDATYMWDAFDLTAGASVTAFENTVGATDLAMTGTAGDKFVRSQTPLQLGDLISQYLSDDGNGYYFCNDVTFEIVMHQHWDDALASTLNVTDNKEYTGLWTSTLIKDHARATTGKAGCNSFRVQDPFAEGLKYPGYIKYPGMTPVNPETGKQYNWTTDNAYASVGQYYSNELNEPFAIAQSFAFDCENEYPQFEFSVYRADTNLQASTLWKFYPMTSKQAYTLFPADFAIGYYAIRAYGEVLTEAELQQNHFADLAKYFEISDTALLSLETLPADYLTTLYADFAAVNFNDTDVDAIEVAIAEKQAAYDAYLAEQAALRYQTLMTGLYVEDATFKWDAFDMKSTDDVVTAFVNQVGTTNIKMPLDVTMGDGYIVYPFTTSSTSAIDLRKLGLIPTVVSSNRYLPDDYSIEMTVHQYWDETCTTGSNKWQIAGLGACAGSWPAQFIVTTQTPSETRGFVKSAGPTRSYYKADGTLAHEMKTSAWTAAFANLLNKPYSLGWTQTADIDTANNTHHPTTITPMRDGELMTSAALGNLLYANYPDNVNERFYFGFGTPFAYYSFRIYPFALNAEQVAQNHFAELCDYFNVSLETLEKIYALDVDVKKALDASFNGKTFADYADADAFALAIDEELAEMALAEHRALLKTLYVDGATYLWDAYGLTAGESVTAFENTVGDTDLAMTGTAGDKFVRSQTELKLGGLISQYLADDGSGYYFCKDVTFEIVLHQHWDDEFAASFDLTDGKQHLGSGKSTLLKDWARSTSGAPGYLGFRTQDPNAEGLKYPGYIKYCEMTPVNPESGKPFNWGADNVYASNGQYYANEVNEPFAIAQSFAFDCKNEYPQFNFTLYRADTDVNATTAAKFYPMTSKQEYVLFPTTLAIGYYAIRAYDRVLSETELQQNHFADLANYFEISVEMIDLLKATPAEKLAAFYAAYDEVNFNDTTAEEFEASITANLAAVDAAIVVGEANKGEFINFLGYQVRTNAYAGIRSRYEVDLDAQIEGIKLVEVGAIMAIATEGRTTADLVVNKTAGGWAATGKQMMSAAVSAEDIFTDDKGNTCFAYTLTFEDEASQTKTYYETEILFRGYVVLEIDGFEYVYYTNMTSEVFGESISMLEASQYGPFANYKTSQAVIAACPQSNQGGN